MKDGMQSLGDRPALFRVDQPVLITDAICGEAASAETILVSRRHQMQKRRFMYIIFAALISAEASAGRTNQ